MSPEFGSVWLWPLGSDSTTCQASVLIIFLALQSLGAATNSCQGQCHRTAQVQLLLSSTVCPPISLIPRTHFGPPDLFNHLHKKSTHLIYFLQRLILMWSEVSKHFHSRQLLPYGTLGSSYPGQTLMTYLRLSMVALASLRWTGLKCWEACFSECLRRTRFLHLSPLKKWWLFLFPWGLITEHPLGEKGGKGRPNCITPARSPPFSQDRTTLFMLHRLRPNSPRTQTLSASWKPVVLQHIP